MHKIEIKKDGKVVCVCADESCLYPSDVMKGMKAAGYKFYQDGRLWKSEAQKTKND